MRIESKSYVAAPNEEQEVISKHELFGWELKSSQEVLSKESHLEERSGDLYSVTTTQNYVKLMFQRDADRPEVAQVKKLEEEYWNLYERTAWRYAPQKSKLLTIVPLVLCGVAVFGALYSLFASGAPSFGARLLSFVIFIAVAAVMFGITFAYNRFVFNPREDKFFAGRRRKEDIEKEVQAILGA